MVYSKNLKDHRKQSNGYANIRFSRERQKQFYEGIVKSNRKKGIAILAKEENVRYLQNMVKYKYATIKDIKKILEECLDEQMTTSLLTAIERNVQ